MTAGRARAATAFAVAALIGGAALWLFWPGVALYDTVAQFGQLLSGDVDDWHPPIMVRLWTLLHWAVGGGTAPLLVLQLGLYATGAGLFAAALATGGRGKAAVAVLALAASPLLLGWEEVVLKDAQLVGALFAATGLIAHARLRGRRPGPAALAGTAILLLYATLLRANALFATVPLTVLLLPRPRRRFVRPAAIVLGAVAVLAVTPLVNHGLLGARPSDAARSEPLFDLAGMAVRLPAGAVPPFTPAERAGIVARGCSKPFFWDPIGDERACGALLKRVQAIGSRPLMGMLAVAIVAHPLAYASHRLAHWNSTERWLVPPGLPEAAPPESGEPNDLGLGNPVHPAARIWMRLAAVEAGTPLGWPILWTAVAAIIALALVRAERSPASEFGFALACSALGLEASFLVISIASDLRYHLWSMLASGLAAILVVPSLRPPRPARIGAVLLIAGIIAGGLWTRHRLPRAPASYQAMLGMRAT